VCAAPGLPFSPAYVGSVTSLGAQEGTVSFHFTARLWATHRSVAFRAVKREVPWPQCQERANGRRASKGFADQLGGD